jgi:cytoskeletal protein CcmA (bactofilin family)
MIRASALLYSLFISLLLISLSSALIALYCINSVNTAFWNEKEKTERNAASGIILLQNSKNILSLNQTKTIDLFGDTNDSVTLTRKNWGAFEIHVSNAFSHHHRFSQIALSGNGLEEDSTMALYLADREKPLSLCGKTEIKGTCFLPQTGVKRAYIEGQNFIGTDLIMGKVFPSSQLVLNANEHLLPLIVGLFNRVAKENDSVINVDAVGLRSSSRSFYESTVFCHSTVPMRIGAYKFSGNIILASDREIRISPDAFLQDVIVCAPKVIIEKGFEGCLQVFAYDSVIVEEKVKLNYPSVIGLARQQKSCQNTAIWIREGAEIEGTVFADQEARDTKNQIKILIDKGVFIKGFVHSSGWIDLKGSVFGSVACTKFILSTPSSVYENHLLNAVIDRTKLSKYFVASSLIKDGENKKTVKWLY